MHNANARTPAHVISGKFLNCSHNSLSFKSDKPHSFLFDVNISNYCNTSRKQCLQIKRLCWDCASYIFCDYHPLFITSSFCFEKSFLTIHLAFHIPSLIPLPSLTFFLRACRFQTASNHRSVLQPLLLPRKHRKDGAQQCYHRKTTGG